MSCLTSWAWLILTIWCRNLNLVSTINSEISRKIGTFWKMRSTVKVKQYHTCVQKRCFSRSSWAKDWLLIFRISIFCNLIPRVDCGNSYSDLTVLHDGEDTVMLLWKNWRTSVGFLGASFRMFSCFPVNFIRQKSSTSLTFSLCSVQFLLEWNTISHIGTNLKNPSSWFLFFYLSETVNFVVM